MIEFVNMSAKLFDYTPAQYDRDLQKIAEHYQVCYKRDKPFHGDDSLIKYIRDKISQKHYSPLEAGTLTWRIKLSIGLGRELLRHRMCVFTQESTRYVNYKHHIEVIRPAWLSDVPCATLNKWVKEDDTDFEINHINESVVPYIQGLKASAKCYANMLQEGRSPQEARGVLALDMASNVIWTVNFRQMRYVLELRWAEQTGKVHPDMKFLMDQMHAICLASVPGIFSDIRHRSEIARNPNLDKSHSSSCACTYTVVDKSEVSGECPQ
jgi:thymidylate synthase (FAD)